MLGVGQMGRQKETTEGKERHKNLTITDSQAYEPQSDLDLANLIYLKEVEYFKDVAHYLDTSVLLALR